jgi:hypothetical protein
VDHAPGQGLTEGAPGEITDHHQKLTNGWITRNAKHSKVGQQVPDAA